MLVVQTQMDDESYRIKVAAVFSSMHTSVVVASDRMLVELKRYNYVTPTNFLELVKVRINSQGGTIVEVYCFRLAGLLSQ